MKSNVSTSAFERELSLAIADKIINKLNACGYKRSRAAEHYWSYPKAKKGNIVILVAKNNGPKICSLILEPGLPTIEIAPDLPQSVCEKLDFDLAHPDSFENIIEVIKLVELSNLAIKREAIRHKSIVRSIAKKLGQKIANVSSKRPATRDTRVPNARVQY